MIKNTNTKKRKTKAINTKTWVLHKDTSTNKYTYVMLCYIYTHANVHIIATHIQKNTLNVHAHTQS